MERYVLRECEQQELLKDLFSAVTDQIDDEDEEWDTVLHALACVLLKLLPSAQGVTKDLKEAPSQDDRTLLRVASALCASCVPDTHSTLHQRTIIILATIARFSRTEAEAESLVWRFFKQLCESLGSRFTRDYLAQAVHRPQEIYGGPTMEEVGDEEVGRRLADVENAEVWIIKPSSPVS